MQTNTQDKVSILVSVPGRAYINHILPKELSKHRQKEIHIKNMLRKKTIPLTSTGPIDILRISCPASKEFFQDIVDTLRSTINRIQNKLFYRFINKLESFIKPSKKLKYLGVSLRLPGANSIPLASERIAESLIKVSEKTNKEKSPSEANEFLEMFVFACAGKEGAEEYNNKVNDGMPQAEAAQEAINNANPLESSEEVHFAI